MFSTLMVSMYAFRLGCIDLDGQKTQNVKKYYAGYLVGNHIFVQYYILKILQTHTTWINCDL